MEFYKNKKENFMAPFYGSLLFTTKFPEIPGTHFIDLRKMKGRVGLAATQWLESFDFLWKEYKKFTKRMITTEDKKKVADFSRYSIPLT